MPTLKFYLPKTRSKVYQPKNSGPGGTGLLGKQLASYSTGCYRLWESSDYCQNSLLVTVARSPRVLATCWGPSEEGRKRLGA